MSIYMKMVHRADIYTKTTITTESGQKKGSWVKNQSSVKCFFAPKTPIASLNRVDPTYSQWERINIFFPADVVVNSDARIYNITDRSGNLVDAGPFLVTQIVPQAGFSGKKHHYLVMIEKVIEK